MGTAEASVTAGASQQASKDKGKGKGKAKGQAPPALKGFDDQVRALSRLVLTHDESIRDMEATHHCTFSIPSESPISKGLKEAGEAYQEKCKAQGPRHTMGPPMGYLIMGALQAIQPAVASWDAGGNGKIPGMTNKEAASNLEKLESRLGQAFVFDGEEVTSCKNDIITRLIPLLKSRVGRAGERIVSIKMETQADTDFIIQVFEACDDGLDQKHGKAPRGLLARQLQQKLSDK